MRHSYVTSSGDAVFVDTTMNIREKLHEVLSALDTIPADVATAEDRCPMDVSERKVLAVLKARRTRARFFSDDLFADPAWDILLELYAASLGQRRMSISSTCIGADVPATTALRWIRVLEKKQLIIRHNDPLDARRTYLSLTERARSSMDSYFANLPGASPSI